MSFGDQVSIDVTVCYPTLTGRPITGPELATLLEVLVSAANEGSLAEVYIGESENPFDTCSDTCSNMYIVLLLQLRGRVDAIVCTM